MTRRIAVGLACALALAASPASAYGPADLLCSFDDPRITESSGVASSARSDGVFYTHNDSGGGPVFFALNTACETLASYTVDGALASDWEDMARAGEMLLLGDIGDNARARPAVTVYEVPEPVVDEAGRRVSGRARPSRTFHLVYEDGPRDAETLLADPATGLPAVVSKEASGASGVYRTEVIATLDGGPRGPQVVGLLRRVGTLPLDELGGDVLATGGDVSPEGDRLVVRTYYEAYEWTLEDGDLASASAPVRIELPKTRQAEAICYTRDGTALLTTSEGTFAPVHRVPAA